MNIALVVDGVSKSVSGNFMQIADIAAIHWEHGSTVSMVNVDTGKEIDWVNHISDSAYAISVRYEIVKRNAARR